MIAFNVEMIANLFEYTRYKKKKKLGKMWKREKTFVFYWNIYDLFGSFHPTNTS